MLPNKYVGLTHCLEVYQKNFFSIKSWCSWGGDTVSASASPSSFTGGASNPGSVVCVPRGRRGKRWTRTDTGRSSEMSHSVRDTAFLASWEYSLLWWWWFPNIALKSLRYLSLPSPLVFVLNRLEFQENCLFLLYFSKRELIFSNLLRN